MTATVADLEDRRTRDRSEADVIGRWHPDVLTREQAKAAHPATTSKQWPSHAALLHRVAALITTEQLPPARVTVTTAAEVLVDATGENLVQNTVRQWAAAIEQHVTETQIDVNGYAATQWSTSGYRDAVWFHITGHELLPTPMVDRFGVGLVNG